MQSEPEFFVTVDRLNLERLKQDPIRAPQVDGSYLLRGSLDPEALAHQFILRQALDQRFSYARAARIELFQQAIEWTRQYLPQSSKAVDGINGQSLIMSGHQPELFHPGVWFKNFVLSEVAKRSGQTAINLIIDNDQQKSNWLSFPAVESERAVIRRQNFAYGGIGQPYEERLGTDTELFDSLPQRVKQYVAPCAPTQLLDEFWDRAKQAPFENIGYRFAAARHQMEWERGVKNLEVPLSQLCETKEFANFVFEILNDSQRFFDVYNQVLVEYRLVNGLSSDDRPVANLERVDQWIELPFWIWSSQFPHRQKLYACSFSDGVEICNESHLAGVCGSINERITSVDSLLNLGNWKLRTRALTTTMYCRAVLGDLFLHGIGGAIYDQLTDEIFLRFFGLELSHFLTATATFRLPVQATQFEFCDLQQAKDRLRRLQWKPEEFVGPASDLTAAVRLKEELLQRIPSGPSKRNWQQEIESVNRALRQALHADIAAQKELVSDLELRLESQKIENSREWSFLLFDEQLPHKLLELATKSLSDVQDSSAESLEQKVAKNAKA